MSLTPLHMAIKNGQYNAVQILCEDGKADPKLTDLNGDTLLHYAAIGQGNANLYIRYLVEKRGLSVFQKNKEGQTAREQVEKTDKKKYHRVIKALKTYEQKEIEKQRASQKKKVKTIIV